MITIKKNIVLYEGHLISEPERVLTADEQVTVIAQWGDTENFWFFTADDEANNTLEWQLYVQHISQPNNVETPKIDISNIDIETLPEEQLIKLAEKLKDLNLL